MKFIRDARDFWFEICEKRYASDPDRLAEISGILETAATKADLAAAVNKIGKLLNRTLDRTGTSQAGRKQEIAELGGIVGMGVGFNKFCPKCRTFVGMMVGDTGSCPTCKTPW